MNVRAIPALMLIFWFALPSHQPRLVFPAMALFALCPALLFAANPALRWGVTALLVLHVGICLDFYISATPPLWVYPLAVVPALVVAAYVRRPPIALAFEGRLLQATPEGSHRYRLYEWIRSSTAPESIFVLDPRPPLETSMGNTPELPTLTGRSIFVGQEGSYMIAPYPEAAKRLALAAQLLDGVSATPSDRDYFAQLGRPVFLVSRSDETSDTAALLRASYGQPVFSSGPLAVFELTQASSGSGSNLVPGDGR